MLEIAIPSIFHGRDGQPYGNVIFAFSFSSTLCYSQHKISWLDCPFHCNIYTILTIHLSFIHISLLLFSFNKNQSLKKE